MNKKAQLSNFITIIGGILVFGLIVFLFLFFTVGLKQIFTENILSPIVNQTLNATSSMVSTDIVNAVNTAQGSYASNWFNFDIVFLLVFIIFVIELFYTASKTTIDNIFSFFGLITIFQIGFLFALTFIGVIRDWLILNFYTNLFDLTNVHTPIIDVFLSNVNLISFILFLACIMISVLDWKFIVDKVTGQEEQVVEE